MVGSERLGGREGGGLVGGGFEGCEAPEMDVRRMLAVFEAWSPAVSFPVALTTYVPFGRLVLYGQLTANSLLGAAGLVVSELPAPLKTVVDPGPVIVSVALATW